MKFPFGAGKFLVCRFLGNVARDRVFGETLACVIPVCPQPGVGHLHPILCSEFSPISLGWKIATSLRRGDCKNKWLVFMAWFYAQCVLVSYSMHPLGAEFFRLKGVCKGERASRCTRCISASAHAVPWHRWLTA